MHLYDFPTRGRSSPNFFQRPIQIVFLHLNHHYLLSNSWYSFPDEMKLAIINGLEPEDVNSLSNPRSPDVQGLPEINPIVVTI